MLPPCTFETQPTDGTWTGFPHPAFTPANCRIRELTPSLARRCLRNRTLAFVGDSQIRDLAMAVGSFLGGMNNASSAALHNMVGPSRTAARANQWESVHPGRRGLFYALRPKPPRNGQIRTARYSSSPDDRAADGYTLLLNEDLYHSSLWPNILDELTAGLSSTADVVFLGFGLHDTYLDPGKYAAKWPNQPMCWTHGRVFQPFLDLWCSKAAATAAAKRSTHAASASAAGVGRDRLHTNMTPVSTRSTEHPLVAWVSMNEQCAEKKPNQRHRYQVFQSNAANEASRQAAATIGVPLLDLARSIRNRRHPGSDRACLTTGDGVHLLQWAGLLQARLLLSYLCVPDGNGVVRFRPPAPHAVARFQASASEARCPPSSGMGKGHSVLRWPISSAGGHRRQVAHQRSGVSSRQQHAEAHGEAVGGSPAERRDTRLIQSSEMAAKTAARSISNHALSRLSPLSHLIINRSCLYGEPPSRTKSLRRELEHRLMVGQATGLGNGTLAHLERELLIRGWHPPARTGLRAAH